MNTSRIIRLARLMRSLYRGRERMFFFLAFLSFLNGIFGALGIGALIPLFALVLRHPAIEENVLTRGFSAAVESLGLPLTVPIFTGIIVALFFCKALILFLSKYVGVRFVADYEAELRRSLYESFLNASWPFLLRQKIGYLENTLMTDVGGVKQMLAGSMTFVRHVLNGVVYAVFALTLAPAVTLLALGIGAAAFAAAKPTFPRLRSYGRRQERVNKAIAHEMNENMVGLKVIKALGVERPLAREGAKLFEEARQIRLGTGFIKSLTDALVQPLSVLFAAFLFLFSYRQPGFELASFVTVVYMVQQVFSFFQSAQSTVQDVAQHTPLAERVLSFHRAVTDNREDQPGNQPFVFRDALAFEAVSFSYSSGGPPALSDVSFSVRKGEMIGMVGPSGAGKTTIADLLLRLFRPLGGRIVIDSVPIENVSLEEWRRNVGYLPQEVFLKNSTAEENIVFFRDPGDHALPDYRAAGGMASIDDVIQRLPHGYATPIGERGVALSVGQRQRVGLARVFARNPSILILDEATSALDNESEQAIKRVLDSLRGKITVILIAHRLSSVLQCDRVIFLEDGAIAEQGAPAELLHNPSSRFSRMYHAAGNAGVSSLI